MPAVITHYTFAKEVMVGPSRPYKEALFLGAQGPDPFFFFGQLPWRKRENAETIDAFGTKVHHMDVSELYDDLLFLAASSPKKDLLLSYCEGLFLHYVLDRSCHPYVFCKAGFSDDPKLAKVYSISHITLEAYLDILIGRGKGTFDYHAEKFLRIPPDQLEVISSLWAKAAKMFLPAFGVEEDSFANAVKDYAAILRFVNSPHALKRWFIGTFIGKVSQPYAMNYPSKIPTDLRNLDYLNEKHGEWPDPVSGAKRTESFFDLWNLAQRDYISVLPLLEKAGRGGTVRGELSAFIHDIDHDGYRPTDKMGFMDPIWPFIPGLDELLGDE